MSALNHAMRHKKPTRDYKRYFRQIRERVETQSQNVIIDNTNQAFSHYFKGNGSSARLGPNTVNATLNSNSFQYRHNRIIAGKTTSMSGSFSINLTKTVFHVGRTNVNYSINCAPGHCSVTYNLFVNDGFWDIDFIDEKVLGDWLNIPRFKPDGLGPNLERFGGTPYRYIPSTVIFRFQNPGY